MEAKKTSPVLWGALVLALGGIAFVLAPWEMKNDKFQSFDSIYEKAGWDGMGSGPGSLLQQNRKYIAFLEAYIIKHNIHNVLDVGCGDWQFSKEVNWQGANYLGIDVVETVIDEVRSKYGSDRIKFLHGEVTDVSDIERYDLVLIKDVLQHLPHTEIAKIVMAIAENRHVIITQDTHTNATNNDVPIGGWRPLNMRLYGLTGTEHALFDETSSKKTLVIQR